LFGTLKKKLTSAYDGFFGIADENGIITACSESQKEGVKAEGVDTLDFSKDGSAVSGDFVYREINPISGRHYYVFIKNDSDGSGRILKLLAVYTESYLRNQLEKHNKTYFYKRLLKDELSHNETHRGISEYKIRNEVRRSVIVVRHGESDYPVASIIRNIYPSKRKNAIVEMDGNTAAYIVELSKNEGIPELMTYANGIVDTVEEELMINASAGVGSIVGTLEQLWASYANACTAMSVGAIFDYETNIFDFNSLGIGKLIYNTEKKILDEFLRETVSKKTFELLDDEIIKTVRCFFKSNLNISETARQMYLHRNTLVYRLDKVQKLTGLDLRKFDDAVSFKAAYMVKCYIDKINQDG
jgi:carbohydrate diacid regulator